MFVAHRVAVDRLEARNELVRFAAECFSFATPPERETVEEAFGSAGGEARPRWRSAVARDAGTSCNFEDVRDHYVRESLRCRPAPCAATPTRSRRSTLDGRPSPS